MATLLPYALTTVEDVKESLGIPSSDHSQDNLIIRKINAATMMIEQYTGVRFARTTYTNEEYDATNIDQLVLKHRPILTFTAFSARDTSLNENDWSAIDSELYFVDYSAAVIDLLFTASGRWNRYRVTYEAGYDPIPFDIAEACATLAGFYSQNSTNGAAIKVKQEGQRRVEYYNTQSSSGSGNDSLFNQLGIDEILQGYSEYPLNPDK